MESDDRIELISLAIQKLIEEKKKNKDGSCASHDDQLLLANLLSQLESLKGDEALQQPGGVTELEDLTSSAVGGLGTKGENGDQGDGGVAETSREEIVNEIRKLKRQNSITHCLLSVMIVLTVVWQLSEVKLILYLKDGLSHPFRSAGSILMGLLRRHRKFGQDGEKIPLIEAPLKMPELPHVDLSELRLNGEKALNHHRSAWHEAKNSLLEVPPLPSLKMPKLPHADLLEMLLNGEEA